MKIIVKIAALYTLFSLSSCDGCGTKESSSDSSNTETTAGNAMDQNSTKKPLESTDLVVGNGTVAEKGKSLKVHYTGKLTDGKIFDSSEGRTPFQFTLGNGEVIAGWDSGIIGMKVGGRRKLTIPPHLAYGEQGYPGAIPPNSTLIFEVELVGVE